VFWVDLATFDERSVALLTDGERIRADAFHQLDGRHRSILGAALLRWAVADRVGIEPATFQVDRTCPTCSLQHGRPQLGGAAQDWFVSVTHAGSLVGVALTQAGPVGLDVEPVTDRDYVPLCDAMLAPGEPRPDSLHEFLVYWTRKESVLKATGDGLTRPMTDAVVSAPSAPPRLVTYGGRPIAAMMVDLSPAPDHVSALTVLSSQPVEVSERHLDAAPR
jgi:4'-phosphopantetheinyl transferase